MFIKRFLCCIHVAGIITSALAFWTLQAQASGDGLPESHLGTSDGSRGHFAGTRNAGIPGYNREIQENVSLERCKAICLERRWCKSVDYERDSRRCFVQPVGQADKSLKKDCPGHPYDHYSLVL